MKRTRACWVRSHFRRFYLSIQPQFGRMSDKHRQSHRARLAADRLCVRARRATGWIEPPDVFTERLEQFRPSADQGSLGRSDVTSGRRPALGAMLPIAVLALLAAACALPAPPLAFAAERFTGALGGRGLSRRLLSAGSFSPRSSSGPSSRSSSARSSSLRSSSRADRFLDGASSPLPPLHALHGAAHGARGRPGAAARSARPRSWQRCRPRWPRSWRRRRPPAPCRRQRASRCRARCRPFSAAWVSHIVIVVEVRIISHVVSW